MKKTLKFLVLYGMLACWVLVSTVSAQVISSRNSKYNNVPDYYYANYKFVDDWNAIIDWFSEVWAMYSIDQEIPQRKFAELAKYFNTVFPNLTKDYAKTYQKCSLLANSLAEEYSYRNMEALMWNTCYNALTQAINTINSSYTISPSVTMNPWGWMAPLTVTFDARGSSDPSMETIPTDNFYRYYRDENGVDRPIWKGQVLSYTFEESGKFIVHLVVRSSNVDNGILDGERDLTINVTPKAADIVVYANTRRMTVDTPLKIWITEWEKWVVFDGSLTKPRGWRKIMSHRWTITNSSESFSYDSKFRDGSPSFINVPLIGDWLFKVTLTTKDNENNTVSETYEIYLSDPVTVIKQSPEEWTTSTTYSFDGSASYSITNRLNTYVWEVFDGNGNANNWNKLVMAQGKKITLNSNQKFKPWNYVVRLTVTDMAWNQNVETKNIYVESTTPIPQFTVTPTKKWLYPSEFTLDASNTLDIDVDNGADSIEYTWSFSTDNVKIISSENNNARIVVQFDEKWTHIVRLTATDQYGKFASVSKNIDVQSTLRPEIEVIPWPITWWKILHFKSSVNKEVWDYAWNFWDGTATVSSESATETQHIYWQRWIYSVRLTVTDKDWETNTVTEKWFIWETDYPIAAYRVTDANWFYEQTSDTCVVKDDTGEHTEEAYAVDRYAKITINPNISVNTKWTTEWLQYVFEKEAIAWANQAKITNEFTTSFSEVGCHYVDLSVKDSNVWKQDKVRIWFKVNNALPTIKNVTLTFPQYTENTNYTMWFDTNSNSNWNKSIFDCSGTNNLTIKITAVEPSDTDGNVSRLKFYYYNIDDPDRILEYKESWINEPYVYFVIPKMAGEYKFWVMVYDNDGWMIDSRDYLAGNPSVYFPAICWNADVPIVTLKVSATNIQVWDEVTYTIVSRISSDYESFQADRTFYYDFQWDGEWDLVTKKDTATYTFTDSYEEWVTPRAAVEYRWKLGQADGATILVKNWIRPTLLYNSYGNTVIFRDVSVWIMQQRQICFETSECKAWNTKFRKTHVSTTDPSSLTSESETSITQNDSFIWKYTNTGSHEVSIYFKNKYGIESQKTYNVVTSDNKENWRIAPGVNMITIPETTFTNTTPEIFLNRTMKNTLLMYISNESDETCYVDTDIATDSNWDGKTDNDVDIQCNKMAKIKYEPDFESAVWRVYFTYDWSLTFKNFYVTFEWIVLELDEEKKDIYNDITILVNGIEDLSIENTDLKRSLDRLRKNLNNRSEVTTLVITINEQIERGWIQMSLNQKEILDSVLDRLSNEDTIISVWINEYEKNKKEILALLPSQWTLKSTVDGMFEEFEENLWSYWLEMKATEIEKIWELILKNAKSNQWNENDFTPYFCNIFDYFEVSMYTNKCGWTVTESSISSNYDKAKSDTPVATSEKSWLPVWLKIILIVLVSWLLVMWWIIIFFSVKAKLSSASESDEEEW